MGDSLIESCLYIFLVIIIVNLLESGLKWHVFFSVGEWVFMGYGLFFFWGGALIDYLRIYLLLVGLIFNGVNWDA